jgi:hypothetical protein
MTILNPSSIGNPDETPEVVLPPALVRMLNPCQEDVDGKPCGGINGFHAEGCPKSGPRFTLVGEQP